VTKEELASQLTEGKALKIVTRRFQQRPAEDWVRPTSILGWGDYAFSFQGHYTWEEDEGAKPSPRTFVIPYNNIEEVR